MRPLTSQPRSISVDGYQHLFNHDSRNEDMRDKGRGVAPPTPHGMMVTGPPCALAKYPLPRRSVPRGLPRRVFPTLITKLLLLALLTPSLPTLPPHPTPVTWPAPLSPPPRRAASFRTTASHPGGVSGSHRKPLVPHKADHTTKSLPSATFTSALDSSLPSATTAVSYLAVCCSQSK